MQLKNQNKPTNQTTNKHKTKTTNTCNLSDSLHLFTLGWKLKTDVTWSGELSFQAVQHIHLGAEELEKAYV